MSQFYRFALLGDPVAHSRSPAIHAEALRLTGLRGEYKAITADPQVLEETLTDLRSADIHGMNVTMPLSALLSSLPMSLHQRPDWQVRSTP